MKRIILLLCLMFSLSVYAGKNPTVVMETSKGTIEIELYKDKAPKSVENFLKYVDKKHYNGTVFHRVIDGFMIQGGGFTVDLKKKDTMAPIQNEADNGLSNEVGTIAMARTSDPHSATAQFYINVNNNKFLDHKGKTPAMYGYAVFGRVTKGMSVVNTIKKVGTQKNGPFQNLPTENIVINYIKKK